MLLMRYCGGNPVNILIDKYNLKDCPFCFHSAIISDEGSGNYWLGCGNENCSVMPCLYDDDLPTMSILWNTRLKSKEEMNK